MTSRLDGQLHSLRSHYRPFPFHLLYTHVEMGELDGGWLGMGDTIYGG